jgi:hypothetical protein
MEGHKKFQLSGPNVGGDQGMNRHKNINFYGEPQDHADLDHVVQKLNLTRSEVCRRALRIGLRRLEKLSLPGSMEPPEKRVEST